jgi:hypothetical protein
MEMIQKIMRKFPEDVITVINQFLGVQKMRNGIYMGQIPKKDPRYMLLLEIPPQIILKNCAFTLEDGTLHQSIHYFIATVRFTSNHRGYSIMDIMTQYSNLSQTVDIVYSIYKYNDIRSRHILQWRYITPKNITDTIFYIYPMEQINI